MMQKSVEQPMSIVIRDTREVPARTKPSLGWLSCLDLKFQHLPQAV